jgi:hypothetical protein
METLALMFRDAHFRRDRVLAWRLLTLCSQTSRVFFNTQLATPPWDSTLLARAGLTLLL